MLILTLWWRRHGRKQNFIPFTLPGCQRPKNNTGIFKRTSARGNKDIKKSISTWQREQVFTVQKHAFSELKNKATGTEIPRKRTHFGTLRSVRRVAICSPLRAVTGVQEENVCSLARSPCEATSHPHPGWAGSNCSLRADVRLLRHLLEQLGLTVMQRVCEDTLCVCVGREG